MIETMNALVVRHRRDCASRFRGKIDWLRLAVLGIFLITFSAIALADALAAVPLPGHLGGSAALFGGVMIALVSLKIGKGIIYYDWIICGISSIGAGMVLHADEQISDVVSLFLVCTFFGTSSVMRLWIGSTASPQAAASWIRASGHVALLGLLWIVGAWIVRMPTPTLVIIALDCLFQGVAFVGFGLSLREAR